MNPEQFRKLALEIPDAVESAHGGHPDFRVAGKVFASLGSPDEDWAMVKLTPDEQEASLANAPDIFRPCNGAWGKSGYTNVHLASATTKWVRPVLQAAARNVSAPVVKRSRRKP